MKTTDTWPDEADRIRPSLAHRLAWKYLKKRGVLGYRFLRYYMLRGGIVTDFYCAELKLALAVESPDDPDFESGITERALGPPLKEMGITLVVVRSYELSIRFLEEIVLRHTGAIAPEPEQAPPLDESQRLG